MSKHKSRPVSIQTHLVIRETCDACRAYIDYTCRLNPPVLVIRPDGTASRAFVPVDKDGWCMQWRQRPVDG